jgi:hypothetical protein
VARRRLTIKHIDPWSVLKFGSVANVALLAIFLLFAGVAWFIVDRLGVVEQVCGIAIDVGFSRCGINAGNLFRALVLLGLLWVVVQSAVLVFLAFLHNLIADLTGGLVVGVVDDSNGSAPVTSAAVARSGPDDTAAYAQRAAPGRASGARAPTPTRSAEPRRTAAPEPSDPSSGRAASRERAMRSDVPSTESSRARMRSDPSTRPGTAISDDQLFGDR